MNRILLNTITVLAIVGGLFLLGSCSKDDSAKPASRTHKLVFKAEASAGCNITNAAYGTDDNITDKSSLSGTTWQSEEITTSSEVQAATISVGALGVNTSSTLTVQIYIDGKLKKEGKSTGEYLSAGATYLFK